MRLDAALAAALPQYSRARLQALIEQGAVTLDGERVLARRARVCGGERVVVVDEAANHTAAHQPQAIALDIVHEDDDLLVINKPAGLVVHPGSGNWSGTLLNALLHYAPAQQNLARAGIVHRLDKDTSGLLVVARTAQAQTHLVRQLQARSVGRHYLALAHGVPERSSASIDAPIGRHPVARTKMAVTARGREAITHYRVRERFGHSSLLECRLETGRTHQIRVHLAHIGHALVGDQTYGRRAGGQGAANAFGRQALHAWRLALLHPASNEACQWQVALAADFAQLLTQLREEKEQ